MRKSGHITRLLLLFVFLASAQACSVLSPVPDRSHYYVLTPAADGSSVSSASNPAREVALGVGPVTLPGYLDRPEIVSRVDSDRLELSASDRWAEPLAANVQRVLAQDLARLLGTAKVALFPWYGNPNVDYRVEVQVHRFESAGDGLAHLDANWLIRDGSGALLFAGQTSTTSQAGSGQTAAVAALSNDLNTLSVEIADRVRAFDSERARAASAARENPGAAIAGDR